MTLLDAGDRERIARDTATSLFVEAGAGSGKTRSLVNRVLTLVEQSVPIERIAAVTFTEKAGAEFEIACASRLRQSLSQRKTRMPARGQNEHLSRSTSPP